VIEHMIEFAKCWCALILQPFHYQRNRNRKFFLLELGIYPWTLNLFFISIS